MKKFLSFAGRCFPHLTWGNLGFEGGAAPTTLSERTPRVVARGSDPSPINIARSSSVGLRAGPGTGFFSSAPPRGPERPSPLAAVTNGSAGTASMGERMATYSPVCLWCHMESGDALPRGVVPTSDCARHRTIEDQAALFGLGKGQG